MPVVRRSVPIWKQQGGYLSNRPFTVKLGGTTKTPSVKSTQGRKSLRGRTRRSQKNRAIMPGRNYNGRNSCSVGFGGSHADRLFGHRRAGNLVVDHHALVVAVEAEVDALFAVLHAHAQGVFGEGGGARQGACDQKGAENPVHDLFLQKRFVLEKLYVRGGWRRVELLPPFRVIYSHAESGQG